MYLEESPTISNFNAPAAGEVHLLEPGISVDYGEYTFA